jgi:CBS domain-containing protein
MTTLQDIVGMTCHHVRSIAPEAFVFDAVESMCAHHVRALLVGPLFEPVGIISERDILERAIVKRRDPSTMQVREVMTTPLVWLSVDCTAPEALEFLRVRHLHQVPVMSEEAVIGIVSSTDLLRWATHNAEVDIRSLTDYCSARYPG